MLSVLSRVLAFLGPVASSVKGFVNAEELIRVVTTSAVSGLLAAAIGVVVAVQGDLGNIIQVPLLVGPVTTALTALVDYLRRKQHGS